MARHPASWSGVAVPSSRNLSESKNFQENWRKCWAGSSNSRSGSKKEDRAARKRRRRLTQTDGSWEGAWAFGVFEQVQHLCGNLCRCGMPRARAAEIRRNASRFPPDSWTTLRSMQELVNSGGLQKKDFQLCLDDLREGVPIALKGQKREGAVQENFLRGAGFYS